MSEEIKDDLAKKLTYQVDTLTKAVKRNPLYRLSYTTTKLLPVILLLVAAAFFIFITLIIALTRLFNNEVFGHRTWATYFLLAAIFYVAGLVVIIVTRPSKRD